MEATTALDSAQTSADTSSTTLPDRPREPAHKHHRTRRPNINRGADRLAHPAQRNSNDWRRQPPRDDAGTASGGNVPLTGLGSSPRHHQSARRRNPQIQPNNPSTGGESLQTGDATATVNNAIDNINVASAHANKDDNTSSRHANQSRPRTNRRGAKFIGSLTEPSENVSPGPSRPSKGPERYHRPGPAVPKNDDLTSTLIHAISTPPFPDCLICFSAIHPAHPTWSCSPSIPISEPQESDHGGKLPSEADATQCCWTTFHLKCIRSWASKSVKDVAEAWRARGEDRKGEWRCPGCRTERETVPNGYWCFCGSTPEPKLTRLATPHSCANLCSRPRPCGHACPLTCHPGPCPPCQVVTSKPCHCAKRTLTFKCSHLIPPSGKDTSSSSTGVDLSCGAICGRKLGCGSHSCEKLCHPGDCDPCPVREVVRCYCGKVDREVKCGEGEPKECALGSDGEREAQKWFGRFNCGNDCNRPFDCGIHFCSKPCHPPSYSPPPCPNSPSQMMHCPCGKHELSSSNIAFFPPNTVLPRTKCSDPIPACDSTCMKPLSECEHVCSSKCHTGPCPPCAIMLVRPCRCGATTKDVKCSTLKERGNEEILCDRLCTALRVCGRHQCSRMCCPLASLAGVARGKGKKRGVVDQTGMDETGLHECDLICGKMLSCGNHRCEERDHRGACPPCLRSGFDEVICHCGRTVLDPPVPCGTRINCVHQCMRPPPPCGHPRAPHSCHEDPSACPPCPFLASKPCACGKKVVDNVRCSQEKVSCGVVCGRLLGCGFHHCERLCHSNDCGPCTSPCGKSRKLCLPEHHPCTLPCHAPASCSEHEPCRAVITLSCPCRRIRQSVPCARSASNPSGCELTHRPKCNNECAIAKRNARLAEALGISPETREKAAAVVFSDELISFGRANPKLLGLVEKTFADFVTSDKKTQVLPQMPPDRRKFVLAVASIYRMDTQMVDQEPHRSVQLIRRIDTRIPSPVLSEVLSMSNHGSLGKLADLRTMNAQTRPSRSPAPPTQIKSMATNNSGSQRGWTAVVSRSGSSTPASSGTGLPSGGSRVGEQTGRGEVQTAVVTTQRQSDEQVPENWEDDV